MIYLSDFESSCNWYNPFPASAIRYDWMIVNGSTGISSIGPATDHTSGQSGQGSYLTLKYTSFTFNSPSSYASPMMKPTPKCVEFYYYLYGAEVMP